MAQETRRGCGYRKVGGLYLCSDGLGAPCCKLPIELQICPTCDGGIKQVRGFRWLDPKPWLSGACTSNQPCLAADPGGLGDRVGLIWIGVKFYPMPEDFAKEAAVMGVSRRIAAVPRGFELGKTWVFLAHPRIKQIADSTTGKVEWIGGVFRIFRPVRIEKLITATQAQDAAEMSRLVDAGVTPIVVPDNDHDHQGTVYDKRRNEDQLEMAI